MKNSTIIVRDLLKIHRSNGAAVAAVNGVTFESHPGEVLLITGPSGSGKTTLLSLLGGLLPPTSGDVSLLGRNLSALSAEELNAFRLRHVGFVFQAFRLIETVSVLDNVCVPLMLATVPRRDAAARAHGLLARLKIEHLAGQSPKALSGGERQRVAIARALALDPPILLADEPTGSLDSVAGHRIAELLRASAKDDKKTVVIVSHDQRVHPFADRILRMEDGTLDPIS